MAARDQVDLNCVESPDALEFTVKRERGWVTVILFPVFAFVVLVWLWRLGSLPLHIMAAVAGAATAITLVANWIHGNDTTLRVTADELVVRGNLNTWFRREVRIDASQLKSLRWESGGEADSGLYARWPWNCRCILAEISPEQAETIRDAVAGKFPEIKIGDPPPASFPFGNESGVTRLGLSDSESSASIHKD
jgi:hypothetical protein